MLPLNFWTPQKYNNVVKSYSISEYDKQEDRNKGVVCTLACKVIAKTFFKS